MIRTTLAVAATAALLAACTPASDTAAPTAPAASDATAASTPAASTAAPTAASVRAQVEREGAAAAVAALSAGDGAGLRALERGVASGEQAWLDVLPLVRPATDGEVATGLRISLAEGLASSNAAGVLRVAQTAGPDEIASLCSADSLLAATPAEQPALTARAIAAVEAVNDPALSASRDACLAGLRQAQAAPPS